MKIIEHDCSRRNDDELKRPDIVSKFIQKKTQKKQKKTHKNKMITSPSEVLIIIQPLGRPNNQFMALLKMNLMIILMDFELR